jgi:hypothetical protein
MSEIRRSSVSLPAVVICAWIIPGGGYFLIGQRARAMTAGVAIIALFLSGIAVGGIRIMDPPGWGQYGYMTQLVQRFDRRRQQTADEYTRIEPSSAEESRDPSEDDRDQPSGSALIHQPMAELADKPWYVGQILCGPITLAASAVSISAAHPSAGSPGVETWPSSHSRSWEIGALYTAVAGMLNLLVIIDAAHRAGQVH